MSTDKSQNKKNMLPAIYYAILIILTVTGLIINKCTVATAVSAVFFLIITGCLLFLKPRKGKKDKKELLVWRFFEKHFFVKTWIIIFVSWLPCLLAYYPVLFNYDVMRQMPEVLSGQYSVFHPILHTLMLGFFFKVGKIIGSINIGFFLYSIVQMAFLSFSMAFSLNTLKRMKVRSNYVLLILIFFAVALFNPIMSISATKDTIFSGFFLISFTLLASRNLYNNKRSYYLKLAIALIGASLFRNNMLYALGAFVVLYVSYLLIKKHSLKSDIKMITVGACSAIFVVLANVASIKIMHLIVNNGVESLSVPSAQMASVLNAHENEMVNEDKDKIYAYLGDEAADDYNAYCADIVKSKLNVHKLNEDKVSFAKIWIENGVKYPLDYMLTFMRLTSGYWSLSGTEYIHMYGDNYDERQGYLLTDMKNIRGVDVKHESVLPGLESIYEAFATYNIQENIPILYLLFAPSAYILTYITFCIKKKYFKLESLLFFVYLLTLLLGPCAIMRYAYPFIICLPIGIAAICNSSNSFTKPKKSHK